MSTATLSKRQQRILDFLRGRIGGAYGLEIQDAVGCSLAGVYVSLGQLCERGLTERHFGEKVRDTKNVRRTLYRLTQRGWALFGEGVRSA